MRISTFLRKLARSAFSRVLLPVPGFLEAEYGRRAFRGSGLPNTSRSKAKRRRRKAQRQARKASRHAARMKRYKRQARNYTLGFGRGWLWPGLRGKAWTYCGLSKSQRRRRELQFGY